MTHRLIIDAIRKCAEEGLTRAEAAKKLELAYQTISLVSKRYEIDFRRKNIVPDAAIVARDNEIFRRFDEGEQLQSIGTDLGLTRERVRQIVAQSGRVPRQEQARRRDAEIAETLRSRHLTAAEASALTGVPAYTIKRVATDNGIVVPKRSEDDEVVLAALSKLVERGFSINEIAGGDRNVERHLRRYCAEKGIRSRAGTRWSDLSHREEIVRSGRAVGKTWNEIAREISAKEGRKVGGQAVCVWSHNNLENIPIPPKPERRRRRKQGPRAKPISPPANRIEVRPLETVKDTAVFYRGLASASQIAEACGVTRNSIIGHWNRARISTSGEAS